MYLLSAFTLGLFGSLHCVGMCSPILLAFSGSSPKSTFWQSRILYNLGRTITYVFLGMLVGTFGHSLILVSTQQHISLLLGILWLLLLLFIPNWENHLVKLPFARRFLLQIKTKLARLLKKDKLPLMFNAGVVNGFLPCGMVYLALSGAMASTDITQSILFMLLFGLGTFPAMLTVALLARPQSNLFTYLKPTLYGLSLVFACLLIVRGLDLGIPFLSPSLGNEASQEIICQ